jgi:putative dehydrogenase
MTVIVGIISPGAMGSGVAARLAEHGVEVRTLLAGRSRASIARAQQAGMRNATEDQIAEADIVLSIVSPEHALELARRLQPALAAAPCKPLYVDCNAVSPATVSRIAAVIETVGCAFVDGGIIGPPPRPGARATRIYLSGPDAGRVAVLAEYGLNMPVLSGPIGVASALKMSYAGITKGFTALGAAMMLAATRGGTADLLQRELAASQPELFAWLARQVPNMYAKAHRWMPEMQEIGDFVGEQTAARELFAAAARFYGEIAADHAGSRSATKALSEFCSDPRVAGTAPVR